MQLECVLVEQQEAIGRLYKYTYLTPRTIRTECVCATSVQLIAVVLQNHNIIATVAIAGTFALACFHYFV